MGVNFSSIRGKITRVNASGAITSAGTGNENSAGQVVFVADPRRTAWNIFNTGTNPFYVRGFSPDEQRGVLVASGGSISEGIKTECVCSDTISIYGGTEGDTFVAYYEVSE